MPTPDPRVDSYIASAAPFARPILEYLRAVIHEAVPSVEETIKWGMPSFTVNGAIVCHTAAFKQHCALVLWKTDEAPADGSAADTPKHPGMGGYGKLRSIDELPPRDVLVARLRSVAAARAAAADARKKGKGRTASTGKAPARRPARAPITVPDYVERALDSNPAARAVFDAFPPSHRRDYVEWIVEAKTAATRERRLAQMLEWVAEGRPRNWKYMRK